ncbi:Hypothetical predicted protein, partial [Pelobates cultripes]
QDIRRHKNTIEYHNTPSKHYPRYNKYHDISRKEYQRYDNFNKHPRGNTKPYHPSPVRRPKYSSYSQAVQSNIPERNDRKSVPTTYVSNRTERQPHTSRVDIGNKPDIFRTEHSPSFLWKDPISERLKQSRHIKIW